ncbi:type II toxin-antitoxin system Phd/YefM family antitoxin [Catenulispora pinisilvae]|uniref:type II toxin-antitoxin system Phd/YefM family antitoxin n=1 Tax=Catenulispora pinisilvae TaxID=2705253 RepID=UPI0018911920|nr:type II toxin-antitoxin system Phd/YefM family antitoxin [Catenulispora pinisilvae]
MTVLDTARAHGLSVTDASRRGLPAIVAEAEQHPVLITRRDQEAVVVIGADRLAELDEAMADMMDLALVVARAVTDTGKRYTLTDAMAEFGMSEEQILALPDDEDDILLKERARGGRGA